MNNAQHIFYVILCLIAALFCANASNKNYDRYYVPMGDITIVNNTDTPLNIQYEPPNNSACNNPKENLQCKTKVFDVPASKKINIPLFAWYGDFAEGPPPINKSTGYLTFSTNKGQSMKIVDPQAETTLEVTIKDGQLAISNPS